MTEHACIRFEREIPVSMPTETDDCDTFVGNDREALLMDSATVSEVDGEPSVEVCAALDLSPSGRGGTRSFLARDLVRSAASLP